MTCVCFNDVCYIPKWSIALKSLFFEYNTIYVKLKDHLTYSHDKQLDLCVVI